MNVNEDLVLWFDLETTGLDSAGCSVLEVGAVVTRGPAFEETVASYDSVVRQDVPIGRLRSSVDEVVRDMHEASGLWEDLFRAGWAPHLTQVESSLVDLLRDAGLKDGQVVPMAGSGVAAFDRQVVAQQMPMLDSVLTYWCIDVGVFRRLAGRQGVWAQPTMEHNRGHRALPDAIEALDYGRQYAQMLRRLAA